MTPELLLIFVKHPIAGQVKTRLAAGIGHEKALKVYHELLAYTRSVAHEIAADKAVWYGNEVPEGDLWAETGWPRFLQAGETLGDRMEGAFRWGLAQGYRRICIIGSDCATLTSAILNQAFDQLSSHDAVIGPANDGGYYLLGMTSLVAEVFHDKSWSTESVLPDTLADLASLNKTHFLLPELVDIDTIEDLEGTFLAAYAD